MRFFWMIELYRRLLETLSSNVVKKLKISKAVGVSLFFLFKKIFRSDILEKSFLRNVSINETKKNI